MELFSVDKLAESDDVYGMMAADITITATITASMRRKGSNNAENILSESHLVT
jgi:hypothetical protein